LSHSLNEIGGLCKRAARGAGLPWGLAEEAANAVRWLCAFDLPGPRLLADRLERFDGQPLGELTPLALDGPWRGGSGSLCPLITGATLSDWARPFEAQQRIELHDLRYPLLCCAFVADVAHALGRRIRIEWAGVSLSMDGGGLVVQGDRGHLDHDHAERVRCCLVPAGLPLQISSPRIRASVDPAAWARLAMFAERTYAPATEASRRLGAGGADDG